MPRDVNPSPAPLINWMTVVDLGNGIATSRLFTVNTMRCGVVPAVARVNQCCISCKYVRLRSVIHQGRSAGAAKFRLGCCRCSGTAALTLAGRLLSVVQLGP